MKTAVGKGIKAIAALLILSLPASGQNALGQRSDRICGTEQLRDPEFVRKAWERTVSEKPGILEAQRAHSLRKGQAELALGDIDVFWMFDFTQNAFDTVSAELRGIGTESNIWISLAELANNHVTISEVTAILGSLETSTPPSSRNPALGIVKIIRQIFGDPPNINASFVPGAGDGMTDFLILDIKDGWSGSGSYIAGYFFDVDVNPASGALGFSNRRDMLYIDSYPGIYVGGGRDPERPLPVLAHEFQHLVNWNYCPSQIVFFNEGLSEYSEYLCGFGLRRPSLYLADVNISLLSWVGELYDYSRAALWTLYSGEQFGDVFIGELTRNGTAGVPGFNAALLQVGATTAFSDAVQDFFVANFVQDRKAGAQYGYLDQAVVQQKPRVAVEVLGANASIGRTGLLNLAVEYVRFRAMDTIRIVVASGSAPLIISSASITDQGTSVSALSAGSERQVTFTGSLHSELILTIQNGSQDLPTSYALTATGATRPDEAVELGHDDGRTLSTSNTLLRSGDTVFVVFDGMVGGRIDSVRMWFETPGSASLFVRDANTDFDLDVFPVSGLGGAPRMVGGPIPFAVLGTTFFETAVDLRDRNIATDRDLVVELIYGAGGPNPRLRRDSAQFITRSYLSLASQPTLGRTLYESLGDFYIRAYVSATPGQFPPPQELPSTVRLYVNYPNPFNPSTTIRYDLSADVRARMVVYDMLGRQIATLVDEFQPAGEYSASWDGKTNAGTPASSGFYLYRLTAGDVTTTRIMVLAR